jgi:RNA polymerase sigma factor (sigma-70 family)
MPLTSEQRWSLSQAALDRLLQRLGSDPEAAAREYEFLRRRLTTFFSLRQADSPESLADETIDRVARRIEEGEAIEHVRAYVHGVAHRVAMERGRQQAREREALETHAREFSATESMDAGAEARAACLDRCLSRLPREARLLLHGYYHPGQLSARESRQRLAQELGISLGALKVRAHRIRVQLHACLMECLESEEPG